VILLLFSLGVEFSLKSIRKMSRAFFGLGALQCILTTLLVTLIGKLFGFDWRTTFVWGSIVSISSTAVVLKVLHQRRESLTPHGQTSIAILLFQDLWIIPLMVLLPIIGAESDTTVFSTADFEDFILKASLFIAFVWFGAKILIPKTLKLVAKTRNREAFLMVVIILSAGMAFVSAQLGLSLALGAFIAGVMISESEYGHQAVADIVPFRDIFMALFFVSAGMLLDYRIFTEHLGLIIAVTLGVFILKFTVTSTLASALGFASRLSALVAIILSQIGEFSFLLASEARRYDLITYEHSQIFLAATVLLMALTPVFVSFGPQFAATLGRYDILGKKIAKSIGSSASQLVEATALPLSQHVVIIGYGHNGETLANILTKTAIPFIIVEMNYDLYQKGVKAKMPIRFGDASQVEVLEHTNMESARLVVLAINDSRAIRQIAEQIKRDYPEIYILARCHYIQEAEAIEDLKLSDLIIGEYEMSFELFARVLRQFGYPISSIEEHIHDLQNESYRSLRTGLKT